MNSSELTNEEKRRIANERQNAVRKAWKNECERVKTGKGTREWTNEEQKELLDRGAIKGYEGHHMKSVSLYPQYAGEPSNIQFLTEEEHLYGAHRGSYHNLTNGYYDPYKEEMVECKGNELPKIPEYELSNNEDIKLKEEIINSYSVGCPVNKEAKTESTQNSEESNGYEV